jgi:hypothetical protein
MSALGQKQISDSRLLMSAIPPKADIVQHGGNVRFVPKADIHRLFDQLVGGDKQALRDGETERLGYPNRPIREADSCSAAESTSSIYFGLSLECDPRKSWRSKRIASHKNRITNAIAAAGIARARKDISSAPPSSAVAITELPRPPVQAVE